MKRYPRNQRNAKILRSRDVPALSRLGLLLFGGLLLAAGFVFAAQQHFAAVEYGYKSETLRTERKKLLEERQVLTLEKQRKISPARLETAAKQLGLKLATARQVARKDTQPIEDSARSENDSRE